MSIQVCYGLERCWNLSLTPLFPLSCFFVQNRNLVSSHRYSVLIINNTNNISLTRSILVWVNSLPFILIFSHFTFILSLTFYLKKINSLLI